jgi:hypothetical protein
MLLPPRAPAARPEARGPRDEPPVSPEIFSGSLAALPLARPWRPGDRIVERRHEEVAADAPRAVRPAPAGKGWLDPLLGRQSAAARSLLTLVPGVSFAGIPFTGVNPPDTVGDVGPGHVVQMVNAPDGSVLGVWSKGGTPLAGPLALDSLWPSGQCGPGGSNLLARGDPVALYDPLADRWLLAQIAVGASCPSRFTDCHLCVALSQTADPVAGGWYLYDFSFAAFPDYPKLAVWPGSYLVGANQGDATGQRPGLYALDRARMLSGQPAGIQRFALPALPRSGFQIALPADLDGAVAPPSGAPGLFLRPRDGEANGDPPDPLADRLELWELAVSWTDPGSSLLSGPSVVEIADYDGGSPFQPAPQPGSPQGLRAHPDIPMHRLQYRDAGSHQKLVGSFTVVAGGAGHLGLRWFELRRAGAGSWTLAGEGTWAPDAAHRFMGSAAADGSGNLAAGYTVSSPELAVFPSLAVAGRRASDPPGAFTAAEWTIATGSAPHENGLWGDYSAASVDPEGDCTFWYTGGFVPAGGHWATEVAAFEIEGCRPHGEIFRDGFESGDTGAWSAATP